MRTVVTVLALLSTAYGQPSNGDGRRIEDADVLIQFSVMPEAVFNLARMTDVARRFLETSAATHKMAVLIAYDNRDVAAHEAANCEGSYRQWRLLYDHFPHVPLAAAQVISFSQDATLRLRTSEGAIRQMVVSGTDPTEFSSEGTRFEILHANGRVRSIFDGCSPGTVDPVLYLRTTARLDKNLCERVTSQLAARLGKRHVEVSFANSRWFPCDGRFPLLYPFGPAEPQLSEEDYYALQGFSCLVSCSGESRCGKWEFRRPHKERAVE